MGKLGGKINQKMFKKWQFSEKIKKSASQQSLFFS